MEAAMVVLSAAITVVVATMTVSIATYVGTHVGHGLLGVQPSRIGS